MRIFFVDNPAKKPITFTTNCENCGDYYVELADRVLEILRDPIALLLCIRCDPAAQAERVMLPSSNGTGR